MVDLKIPKAAGKIGDQPRKSTRRYNIFKEINISRPSPWQAHWVSDVGNDGMELDRTSRSKHVSDCEKRYGLVHKDD